MATPFHAELVTPERILFSGEVDEISMRTDSGEIAFLAHHEDYLAAVDITVARLSVVDPTGTGAAEGDRQELRVAVHGGFIQVDGEGVKILAGVAELAAEIDVERARRAAAEAEAALAAGGSGAPGSTDDGAATAAGEVRASGAMLALLAPGSPDVALRRARTRLEAAGAS